MPLPLSYVGSCEAWFELLSIVPQNSPAQCCIGHPPNVHVKTHTVVMQHWTPSNTKHGVNKNSRRFLKTCLSSYKGLTNTTWSQMELLDFKGFNTTVYFPDFLVRNASPNVSQSLSVLNTIASFCIRSSGVFPVGTSVCNTTYSLNVPQSPALISPPNVRIFLFVLFIAFLYM